QCETAAVKHGGENHEIVGVRTTCILRAPGRLDSNECARQPDPANQSNRQAHMSGMTKRKEGMPEEIEVHVKLLLLRLPLRRHPRNRPHPQTPLPPLLLRHPRRWH